MKVWRRLHRWSMTSWITLSSTPAMHQSDAASNLSCLALLYSEVVAELCHRFCSQLDWGHGAFRWLQIWKATEVTTISEIIALYEWRQQMAHKLFEWAQHSEKITARRIYQNRYCGIATYITNSLQTPGKPIILFISSRRTIRNWC